MQITRLSGYVGESTNKKFHFTIKQKYDHHNYVVWKSEYKKSSLLAEMINSSPKF